ncbi:MULTISPECIES: hypothetical protein [unclassified Acinetobacter]|uniref:hypothetical protein n=1 Tax=unclassified Acinetobacter TaxID=196816 RepID=UPI0022EAB43F|nr:MULTISPECIES: hypothetical protein [unclassified Acinetobacter]MDA3449321.1 hypothetical protein [Acinetobacter sp. AOR40_HL]MDA3456165.1 hypothetical protein [Acinetobacter sp. AOR39_HL]
MRDAKRLAEVRKLPCMRCGAPAPSQAAHSNSVLSEKQYQALNSVAYKPIGLGEAIGRHVNEYLSQQQRQGGLLSK